MNGRLDLRIITQPYAEVYWGYFRSLVLGNSLAKHNKLGSFSYSVVIFPSSFPTYRLVIMLALPISHVWLGPVKLHMRMNLMVPSINRDGDISGNHTGHPECGSQPDPHGNGGKLGERELSPNGQWGFTYSRLKRLSKCSHLCTPTFQKKFTYILGLFYSLELASIMLNHFHQQVMTINFDDFS